MTRAIAFRLSGAVLVLVGVIGLLSPPAAAQPALKKGGALKIALIGEPPTLDMHMTTAVITREIMLNVVETLFTLDAKYQPVPLLARPARVRGLPPVRYPRPRPAARSV